MILYTTRPSHHKKYGITMDEKKGKLQIGIALVIFAAGGLIHGVREFVLTAKTSPSPQQIRYKQLASQGYGQNAFMHLTDAVPVTEWLVYRGKGETGPWEYAYVPAIADDNPWAEEAMAAASVGRAVTTKPKDIHVLLKFTNIRDPKDLKVRLWSKYKKATFRGVIINEIDSLGSKEKTLLRQGYPGLDVDNVWILEVGRTSSKEHGWLFVGLGTATLIGGLLVLVSAYRTRRAVKPGVVLSAAPLSDNNDTQRARDAEQLAQFHRDEPQRTP